MRGVGLLAVIAAMGAALGGTPVGQRAYNPTQKVKPYGGRRGRKRKNSYGASLLRHFDSVGINWSSKGNRK